MRTTAGSALVLIIAGAFAAPAPAATLVAPGSVAPGEQLAVTAIGLTPGVRYAVFLSKDGFAGLPCVGGLARRTARDGEPTVFSGALPTHLRCDDAIPSRVQPEPPGTPRPVEPGGGYRLIVCEPADRECGKVAEARRAVHVVPAGQRCPLVVFTPNSDHGAFQVRARNVGCGAAERVARGAVSGDRRYRRLRFRCRGVFDDFGLPHTVYRCVKPGARVTFVAS